MGPLAFTRTNDRTLAADMHEPPANRMPKLERVSARPIRDLLCKFSLRREAEIDKLFAELNPSCELDREEDRVFFQADSGPNVIRIGLKCTVRLQAHAYAAGVILAAIGTPGFKQMGSADRQKLLEPADHFLNWAVGLDVEKWLSKHGVSLDPDHLLSAGSRNLPTEMLNGLTDTQRTLGEGLFRSASAFILLHELGHLKLQHPASTIENEKDADRFAAEWMTNDDMQPRNDPFSDRIVAIYGIAVALLWLTVLNIFMGPSNGSTHPQAYDRLFQVLDQVVDFTNDDEQQLVWEFVSTMLFIHMYSAGFDFDPQRDAIHMQGDARDEVNYLINRIANRDVKR